MTTTFTTLYKKSPYQGYDGPLLTVNMVTVLMLLDTTDTSRLPKSMVHSRTTRALNKHRLLKGWYLHLENVEKDDKLTYKPSDLDRHIPQDKPGHRLVHTWQLSDEGQLVADTIQHLRHLRRVMRDFNVMRGEVKGDTLTHEQSNALHWLYQSIPALDPHDLTAEPVGALADQVQQEIAKKAASA